MSPLLVFLAVLVVLAVAGADVPAGKEFADVSGIAVWHGLYNATGATGAASMMSGLLQAAIWTYVVVLAAVLLVLERRAHTAGRPSVIGPRSSGSGGREGRSLP